MVIFRLANISLQYEKCLQYRRSTQCMGIPLTFLQRDGAKTRIRWFDWLRIVQSHMSLEWTDLFDAFKEVDLSKSCRLQPVMHTAETVWCRHSIEGYSENELQSNRAYSLKLMKRSSIKEFSSDSAILVYRGKQRPCHRSITNYDCMRISLLRPWDGSDSPKSMLNVLRQSAYHWRVKNTFEPDHTGNAIMAIMWSDAPCGSEIIAGCRGGLPVELFDQDMAGRHR